MSELGRTMAHNPKVEPNKATILMGFRYASETCNLHSLNLGPNSSQGLSYPEPGIVGHVQAARA